MTDLVRTVGSVLAIALVASCSLVAAKHPGGGREPCLSSRAAPIVDAAMVASAAVADIVAATCSNDPSRVVDRSVGPCFGRDVLAGMISIVALPAFISALYGFAADRCDDVALH